jgi:hypothetical protein
MAFSHVTDSSAVLRAIWEFNSPGREVFLARYGLPKVAAPGGTRQQTGAAMPFEQSEL